MISDRPLRMDRGGRSQLHTAAMPLTIIPQPRADYAGPSRADKHTLNSNATRGEYLSPDTFSPVNENGSFAFDRVLKRGKVLHRSKNKHVSDVAVRDSYM